MSDYLPGSFFLTKVPGLSGYAINLGQALCGDGSRWSHAGIVLDADGTVLEAEPGGARIANLSEYAGRPLLVSDAPVQERVARSLWKSKKQIDIEGIFRALVVREARKLGPRDGKPGVPYSPVDYLALALLHLHLPSKWIRQRVETSHHLICSDLVDRVYMNAGIHLFDDGRLAGDVLPADLAAYAEDHAA